MVCTVSNMYLYFVFDDDVLNWKSVDLLHAILQAILFHSFEDFTDKSLLS